MTDRENRWLVALPDPDDAFIEEFLQDLDEATEEEETEETTD